MILALEYVQRVLGYPPPDERFVEGHAGIAFFREHGLRDLRPVHGITGMPGTHLFVKRRIGAGGTWVRVRKPLPYKDTPVPLLCAGLVVLISLLLDHAKNPPANSGVNLDELLACAAVAIAAGDVEILGR